MDDGGSPAIGLIAFLILTVVSGLLYGFLTALEEISERQVQKWLEEGNKRAKWLLMVKDSPYKTRHAIQMITTLVSGIFGICQIGFLAKILADLFSGSVQDSFLSVICYVLAAVLGVFLFAVIGIIAPQKVAARKPEKWLSVLSGFVHGLLCLIMPYTFLAEQASNLLVRIVGVDPNASFDDVTEEEIISMVNEGHEQGVLQASEAEMIHNIFEFDDKEAKDIMTHRKNIVAVDGRMKLREVLEFVLDGTNSRFPVYREDIDHIIGILHMKDVMIESRKEQYLDWRVQAIPGLVREAMFIPETRNINDLFKAMQSQKNHMVIVVDEYGQTAGLVAMEDILEEIVGNIFDEYDKEETVIVSQPDGSYLMSGMAPFDEVCQLLQISLKEEEFETLNGFLISLIGKIPADHEKFELTYQDFKFQVESVRDKMIHTVRVIRKPEGS
ncbi:MAG: HlyC/CorC family transporter [Lachnospiraceae bacterium]|nr:HlyC/CorC family transporter [Lachnospiraceae bacterium]